MADLDFLRALLQALVPRVLQHLPHNERVINGRLVSQDALANLDQPSEPDTRTVRFGEPLPPNAADVGWPDTKRHFSGPS